MPLPKNPHSIQPARPPGHRPYVVLAVDHYRPQVHAGVVRVARESGWDVDASMARWRSLPQDVAPDGILLTASEPRMLDWTARFSCPVVHLHSLLRMPGKEPVTVHLDYAAAGRMGARHLLETGGADYAFFRRFPAEDSTLMRDAFLEEITSAGFRPLLLDMPDEMPDMQAIQPIQRARRIEWLAQRLPGLPTPIAIMAEEDRFAVDLILAALRVGLRVPEEIAVLGSEDDPFEYGLSPVSVSSVECRLEASGVVAAACLRELMAGRELASRELLLPPVRVTARRSTDFFNHPDPRIAAAILHLRRNYREPINAESLARIAAVSRRGLQDVIKSVTGCTMTDELARLRLMHAEKLLHTTDLKLQAIAYESGLGQDKNLIRLFQKKHGVSPSTWREMMKSGELP